MKKMAATSLKAASLSVVALMAFSDAPAFATEGLFPNGNGARHRALAGAGSADGKDATVQTINPASLTYMLSSDEGNSLAIAATLFSPHRKYTVNGIGAANVPNSFVNPGSHESDRNFFVIPNLAWAKRVNSSLVDVIGFAASATGGMNTHYDEQNNPFAGPRGVVSGVSGKLGINYEALQLQLSLAKKFGALSVGVQPIIVRQTLEVDGLDFLANFDVPGLQRGRDTAWGGGVRAGVHLDMGNFRAAASYTSRIYNSEFNKYASLIANNGDIDLPQNVQVGVAVDLANWTLMADYRWIDYGQIEAISRAPTFAQLGDLGLGFVGTANGIGFGWDSIHVIKVGVEGEDVVPGVDVRFGYSYNTQALNTGNAALNAAGGPGDAQFFANILAPATIKHHFTAGAAIKDVCGQGCDLELAGSYAPTESVDGAPIHPTFAGGAANATADVEMYQYAITAGIKWGW